MAPQLVLMVAEKPSIALTIAQVMSHGQMASRRSWLDVHEFNGDFRGGPARFRVTSVIGHVLSIDLLPALTSSQPSTSRQLPDLGCHRLNFPLAAPIPLAHPTFTPPPDLSSPPLPSIDFPPSYQSWDATDPASLFTAPTIKTDSQSPTPSIDFPPSYQSWDATDPASLFTAPTIKTESNPKAHVCKHLQTEAKGCDALVLWLDCDREGENICFEAIGEKDIRQAMARLGAPNEAEAKAVDARQEIDLKVGVAFTRFQTRFFQGKYGNLDSSLISYGPCQTPTLGFCVARHQRITSFVSEPFWAVRPIVVRDGRQLALQWARGRLFDKECGGGGERKGGGSASGAATSWHCSGPFWGRLFDTEVAEFFQRDVAAGDAAVVKSVAMKEERKGRPTGLNTVEMLKAAASGLGMGPHHAMQIAERLCTQGYISYPRTESTAYPSSFDYKEALSIQSRHPIWGEYVQSLLQLGPSPPRAGKDEGDHPPITPMRAADEGELGGGDAWRLYDLVTRHFIGSFSPDCRIARTRVTFSVAGEHFSASGRKLLSAGFTAVMPWLAVGDEGLPAFVQGESVALSAVELYEAIPFAAALHCQRSCRGWLAARSLQSCRGWPWEMMMSSVELYGGRTSPPDYLTESELIGLMERHGIGTDASIPVHINNICERNYAQVRYEIGEVGRVWGTLGCVFSRINTPFGTDASIPVHIIDICERNYAQVGRGWGERGGGARGRDGGRGWERVGEGRLG
ncbi:unnamed protein product [Closterium sp. Naga37s-1]|nr:unnamed protein product [Closterium sp. Naga37s-1]